MGSSATDSAHAAMTAVAHAHAAAEARGDLAGTLGTLDDVPVFEFQPCGRVLRGKDAVRRYYEHFFAEFLPRTVGFSVRSEWSTPEGLGQEYTLRLRLPDGGVGEFGIIGILLFGVEGLAGERIYAADALLELMLGPVFAETEPLSIGDV